MAPLLESSGARDLLHLLQPSCGSRCQRNVSVSKNGLTSTTHRFLGLAPHIFRNRMLIEAVCSRAAALMAEGVPNTHAWSFHSLRLLVPSNIYTSGSTSPVSCQQQDDDSSIMGQWACIQELYSHPTRPVNHQLPIPAILFEPCHGPFPRSGSGMVQSILLKQTACVHRLSSYSSHVCYKECWTKMLILDTGTSELN